MINLVNEKSVTSERILYTPSPFAKKSLLYLQEAGTLKALKPHTNKRSSLSSYLFFIVLNGEGTLKYEKEEIKLKKGYCAFIDCKKKYSHKTSSNNLWELAWIHFDGENMPEIYDKFIKRGGKNVFKTKSTEKYVSIITDLYSVAKSDDYIKDMKINELISGLLTEIMKTSLKEEMGDKLSKSEYGLSDILEYLEQNYKQKISLDELSERFYINKFYLTRIFKERYGVSILSYVNSLKITNAKQLLRFSDKTVEAISFECGFSDANYFSRTFKKLEGVSPFEYRKMWVQ